MSRNSVLFFALSEKDDPEKFSPLAFSKVVSVNQDKSDSQGVIDALYEESVHGNTSPNIAIHFAAHGEMGNFAFGVDKIAIHPAEILRRVADKAGSKRKSHITLDMMGCQVGAGILKERKGKKISAKKAEDQPRLDFLQRLYDGNEEVYAKDLPANSSVIINGGNKPILISVGKYLLEQTQQEAQSDRGILDQDSSVFEQFLFKISQPNTVKLAHKGADGKMHFFKSSGIRPTRKEDTNPRNLRAHIVAEMGRFIEWCKSEQVVSPKEYQTLQRKMALLEGRLSDQYMKEYGDMSLCIEVVRGKTKYAQHYIDNGYSFNLTPKTETESYSFGFVSYAIKQGGEQRKFVLDNIGKANTSERNSMLISTLKIGVQTDESRQMIAQMLDDPSFDPNLFPDDYRGTPLQNAVARKDLVVVRKLVQKGALVDKSTTTQDGTLVYSPLVSAINSGDASMVALLLQSMQPIDLDNKSGVGNSSLLTRTIKNCQNPERCQILEMLLKRGADPNFRINGLDHLIFAVEEGDDEAVKLLLKYRANANYVSPEEDEFGTALTKAVNRRRPDIVRALVRGGANIDLDSIYGTPLLNAIRNQDTSMLTLLAELGANFNHQNKSGGTPLITAFHTALNANNPALLNTVIQLGAKITEDVEGMALFAESKGSKEIARVLRNARDMPVRTMPAAARSAVETFADKPEPPPILTAAPPPPTKTVAVKPKPVVATRTEPVATIAKAEPPIAKPIIKSTPTRPEPEEPEEELAPIFAIDDPIAMKAIPRPSSPRNTRPNVEPTVVRIEQPLFAKTLTSQNGETKQYISITKNDFTKDGVKKFDAEQRHEVTPQDLSIISGNNGQVKLVGSLAQAHSEESDAFESQWGDFGGLKLVEEKDGAKFFNTQIKNFSFRNCILVGVDFSAISKENFVTLKFLGCKFNDCTLPKGVKMVETINENGISFMQGVEDKSLEQVSPKKVSHEISSSDQPTPADSSLAKPTPAIAVDQTKYTNMDVKTPQRPSSRMSQRQDHAKTALNLRSGRIPQQMPQQTNPDGVLSR